MDEGSATVAKEALHNYKLDGENKIKVRSLTRIYKLTDMTPQLDHVRKEVNLVLDWAVVPAFEATVLCIPLNVLVYHFYVEVPRARYRTKLGNLQELLMAKADGMVATLAPLDI
jgi:hypothetical protein